MKTASLQYNHRSFLTLLAAIAIIIYSGSAQAGDYNMQQNLSNLSELTSKWSKQLSSGKVTPEAQEKLAELRGKGRGERERREGERPEGERRERERPRELPGEVREKLAELLSLTSQVLQDMSEKSGTQMHMEHGMKIEAMKKEWDPFDTSDRM